VFYVLEYDVSDLYRPVPNCWIP